MAQAQLNKAKANVQDLLEKPTFNSIEIQERSIKILQLLNMINLNVFPHSTIMLGFFGQWLLIAT